MMRTMDYMDGVCIYICYTFYVLLFILNIVYMDALDVVERYCFCFKNTREKEE